MGAFVSSLLLDEQAQRLLEEERRLVAGESPPNPENVLRTVIGSDTLGRNRILTMPPRNACLDKSKGVDPEKLCKNCAHYKAVHRLKPCRCKALCNLCASEGLGDVSLGRCPNPECREPVNEVD